MSDDQWDYVLFHSNVYEEIANILARGITNKLTNSIILELKKQHIELIGEDTCLKNLWEEICVITQEGENFHTESIQTTIYHIFEIKINKLNLETYQLCAIWLRTSNGIEWKYNSEENKNNAPPNLSLTYSMEDIGEYIVEDVLGTALNYSNNRIEKYQDSQYEMDW